jgi:hypothetical protein
MAALQQNPASVALTERRRIVIGRAIEEVAPEAGLIDLETGEFRIVGTRRCRVERLRRSTDDLKLFRFWGGSVLWEWRRRHSQAKPR